MFDVAKENVSKSTKKNQRNDFLWDDKIDFPSREIKTTKWETAG